MQRPNPNLYLFVASSYGLFVFERRDGGWAQVRGHFEGDHVTSVTAREGGVLVGTRDGIYRSTDIGQTWWPYSEGLTQRHIRWLLYHPDGSGRAVAGTEPAAIFVTHGAESEWRECREVADLRDENGWYLPYSPEAGCVRGFAFHSARGYAAVEQGGLLRSDDYGEGWSLVGGSSGVPEKPAEGMIHPDVHSVTIHPSSPDRVIAPTGGGLYESHDGGEHWEHLYDCYCRAVWVDPGRPDHMIFGPADGVDKNGRIEETINGGQTWESVMDGLTGPWPHHMVERFLQADDELLAVLSNGQLITSSLDEISWRSVLPATQSVNAVDILEF
jgi:photosystem II stability/assembly factor-like uncharacterized protein